jgi:hypothetical protein
VCVVPHRAGRRVVGVAALGDQPLRHRGDHRGRTPLAEELLARVRRVLRCRLRLRVRLRLGIGLRLTAVLEVPGDPGAEGVHVDAARVRLPWLPLLVADDGVLVPAVRTADGRRRPRHRVELGRRPRLAPCVDALEAVEVPVAVGVCFVVARQARLLGDDREQDVCVPHASVVGPAVADQVDRPGPVDDAMAKGTWKILVADAAQLHHVLLGRVRPRVVDHDPVRGAPVAVGVPVVGAPFAVLDHAEPGALQHGQESVRAQWCSHALRPSPLRRMAVGRGRRGGPVPRGARSRWRVTLIPCYGVLAIRIIALLIRWRVTVWSDSRGAW